ncbi:hypothetical protein DUNSADRAFT_11424 [Dunaliella salina]|uniref:Uncharacterized protein n=1 Tax=Dunaliella salina TaxID=3046 RepID=A0ABQ7GDF5_DUNSA|nr:hypothetical protein DUNSADRAFT_11424 [Dunaliella salina]|eukprot:KAF5832638.1 hypothetical protein DUNSADRAFT_11424 [Dunaliella salina]
MGLQVDWTQVQSPGSYSGCDVVEAHDPSSKPRYLFTLADEEAHDRSVEPRSPFTLGHEGSEGSSGSSDGEEGDEDLFCLFDRESQALKDNIDAYNSGALHRKEQEQQAQGEGHPCTQCGVVLGPSPAPPAPQTFSEGSQGSPAAPPHTPEAHCTPPPTQQAVEQELPASNIPSESPASPAPLAPQTAEGSQGSAAAPTHTPEAHCAPLPTQQAVEPEEPACNVPSMPPASPAPPASQTAEASAAAPTHTPEAHRTPPPTKQALEQEEPACNVPDESPAPPASHSAEGSPAAPTHTPEAHCTPPPAEQATKQEVPAPNIPSASPSEEVRHSSNLKAGEAEDTKAESSRHNSSSSSSSSSGSKEDSDSTHGGDNNGGESSVEHEEPVGEGGLLPPHQFALHLMAHDLRTLPAHLGSGPTTRASGAQQRKTSSPSSDPPHPTHAAGMARFAAAGSSFPPSPPHISDTSYHLRHLASSPSSALPNQANTPRTASTGLVKDAAPAQHSYYERAWHHWSPTQLRQHLGLSTRPLSGTSAAGSAQQLGHSSPVTAANSHRPSSATPASSSVGRRRGVSAGSSSSATTRPPQAHPAGHGSAPGMAGRQPGSSSSAPDISALSEGADGGAQGGDGGPEAVAMGGSVRLEMPTLRTMMEGPTEDSHQAGSNEAKEGRAGRTQRVGRSSDAPSSSDAGGRGGDQDSGSALKYEEWFARMMGEATASNASGTSPSGRAVEEHPWPGFGGDSKDGGAGASWAGSMSSAADPWAGPASQEASTGAASSSGSDGHQLQQEASRQGRDAARLSRPSTAPSTRHGHQHIPAHLAQVPSPPYHAATSPGVVIGQRPARLTRPASAYAKLRGGGAHGSPPTVYQSYLAEPAWEIQTPCTPPAASDLPPKVVDHTAAVNVGKSTVSVYVEDTSRRIMEANRWMASLELKSRYRLRSRLSNMIVQVYDSTWQPEQDLDEVEAKSEPQLTITPEDTAAAAPTTKELTIKQFLALHQRLKAKVIEASAIRLSSRGRTGSPGRPAVSAPARPKSAAAKPVAASQGGALHAGPARRRPMSAHAPGGAKLVEQTWGGARSSEYTGGGFQGKEGTRAKHVPASPKLQLHQKQREEVLCVSVPHTVQQVGPAGRCFGMEGGVEDRMLVGAPRSPGKAGSTAQVKEELEGLAIQCKAISRNIGLLGGVIC